MKLDRLKSELLPLAFSKEGIEFVTCEFDKDRSGEDQFCSSVMFAKVTVKIQNVTEELPVVIKVEPFSQKIRELINTDIQSHNEVFMYTKVLPLLGTDKLKESIFPNFHYGVGALNNFDNNIIILQDLKPLGFRLTEEKAFLDFNHVSLAMEKLGQFHGLSYETKVKFPEEFSKVSSKLEDPFCRKGHKLQSVVKSCLHRAVDPLLNNEKYTNVLQSFMERIDNDLLQFLLEIVSPTDPQSVICHGDFCRNNMLFKYSKSQPIDVRFFDIATSRCASPVIDISFFLFLNTSPELRRTHWDTLLEIYHRGLSTTTATVNIPTLEDIKEAVRQKSVWGLVHCSFFLPMMLFGSAINSETMTDEELVAVSSSRGGDEATKVLNNLVEEMVERNMFNF